MTERTTTVFDTDVEHAQADRPEAGEAATPASAATVPATVQTPRPSGRGAAPTATRGSMLLLGVGLLLIGANLRAGVASIGPVIADIRADLGMLATAASLLTTIPVFAFGAFAFFTPTLSRRFGLHRLLGAVMVLLAAGIALRYVPAMSALFVGTLAVGAAIAIGNVLMPTAIKSDFSHRVGLMMGLYTTVLTLGAAAASGFTVPLTEAAGGSWRAGIAFWALPALVAFFVWVPQLRGRPARRAPVNGAATAQAEATFKAVLFDPIAIAVTWFMGLQSAAYYTSITWVPTLLQDAGADPRVAGLTLAFSAIPAVAASLVAPGIAGKLRRTWPPVAVAVAFSSLAYLGLALAPGAAPLLWMTLLGLGQGASVSLALTYIVWRSPDAQHTSQLSTMAQGFGYLFAGLGPIGIGFLYGLTKGWTVPLIVLGLLLVAQLVAGVRAARPVHILENAN